MKEFCSLEFFHVSFFSLIFSFTFVYYSLKEGTLNREILQFKSTFPREVLLCRVWYYCFLFLSTRPCFTYLFSLSLMESSHACSFCYTCDLWASSISNGATISLSFLFQVGDFYEALGIDACILVEYAGLNPFGGLRTDSIPRAGCPVVVWNAISVFPRIKAFCDIRVSLVTVYGWKILSGAKVLDKCAMRFSCQVP